jgi:hypothetical protein
MTPHDKYLQDIRDRVAAKRAARAASAVANAAKRAERLAAVRTCQICERQILANTGLIAHHGYQRPDRGSGWQTASCFGARYRPYEVACDALPPAIKSLAAYIEGQEAALAKWFAQPPAGIEWRPDSDYDRRFPCTVLRPMAFDPAKDPAAYRERSYESLYFGRKHRIEQNIKYGKSDHARLVKRLAAWKAPEPAPKNKSA